MAVNLKIQTYRGTLASLSTLATTGSAGVLAWTTDSYELFVDLGSGGAGIGPGNAWQRLTPGIAVFNVATPAGLTALAAQIGDFALSASDNETYVLAAYPATSAPNWKAIAASSASAPSGFTDVQWLASATAHEFVTYIDSSGVQHLAQPSFSDISGTLSQTQLPSTIGAGSNLTDIDCGSF